jgi:sigma-E factor negative regulatory protein RseB
LLPVAVVLLCANVAWAEVDPAAQLQRMSRAMRDGDYQGALIYQHDGRIDSLRIFHAAGKTERERVVSLSGDAREVVRAGANVVCRVAGAQSRLVSIGAERSLVPLVPRLSSDDLGPGYRLVAQAEERVAGYAAQVIEVQASDEFRYGYKLWIERDSGLLLRAALLAGRDQPLEQMMFVNVEIGAAPREEDLALSGSAGPQADATEAEVVLNTPARWTFEDLPAGFRIDSRFALPGAAAGGEHLLLTDGVANVSVYLEPRAASGVAGVSLGTRGALSVYSRDAETLHVVVLGTVPPATVQRIAQALRPLRP